MAVVAQLLVRTQQRKPLQRRPTYQAAMEIVWQSSETPSRKRTSQACRGCRARKKRCFHVEKHKTASAIDLKDQAGSNTEGLGPFVNGYDPESDLAHLSEVVPTVSPTIAQLASSSASQSHLEQNPEQSSKPSMACAHRGHCALMWYKRRHNRKVPKPTLSESYRRYLEEVGAFLELPRQTSDALIPTYISLLNDLIPVVDGAGLFRQHSNGESSMYLVRAICLVTSRTKQAAPFLRLGINGPVLDPLIFASKLREGLDAAMKADLEPDRITKVQILALMHLHHEGLSGVECSSSYLSQAIFEAWSMGLHIIAPITSDQEQCNLLWWSLRNFDRLNKPIMGATPFITDDTDIGIERIIPRKCNYRSQLMGVAITLGDLMVTATRSYKASLKTTIDECKEFPSFEEITKGIELNNFHSSHKGYLEIWYHVAAMLSCRYSGPGTDLYSRRLTSADRVLCIISSEGNDMLPPLPLVPYALSMSTTVIYRALLDNARDTKKLHDDLGRCCELLDIFSQSWTSAKGVATLARRLWEGSKSGTGRQRATDNEPRSKRSGTEMGDLLTMDTGPSHIHHLTTRNTTAMSDTAIPSPVSVGTAVDAVASYGAEDVQAQLLETWTDIDNSCLQLDGNLYDLFDHGMPSLFRDPSAWEFLHMANRDVAYD
ncbi:hypothetical protein BX600DRAFT_477265 [Xylariales sp. PMI_506]|nr:hypothetical protein BX600DRAFT_477265 [Xylariales sp. PMI_506]